MQVQSCVSTARENAQHLKEQNRAIDAPRHERNESEECLRGPRPASYVRLANPGCAHTHVYRQCDMNIGKGGRESILAVAPPRMNSRMREWPYAPMTRISASWVVTYDRKTSPTWRPAPSTTSSTRFTPWWAKCLASSAPECLVSILFSFVTVTTRTRLAFSKIGRASATARVAGRLKSHATTTVSSAKLRSLFQVSGKMIVGRPEPKIIDSAYHWST